MPSDSPSSDKNPAPAPATGMAKTIVQAKPAATAKVARNGVARRGSARLTPVQELEVLIRARYPIIYITSWEEERVEQAVCAIAEKRGKKVFVWSFTQGIVRQGSEPQRAKGGASSTIDPILALDTVLEQVEPAIYLFKDFHPFLEENRCNIGIIRRLRDVAQHLRNSYKTIVVVAPLLKIAPELSKDVTVIDYGLPGLDELNRLLDRIIDDVRDKPQIRIDLDQDGRERLLKAAQGLTLKEAENVFAKTLVLDGKLDADDISVVFSEKQQIVRKGGLLEYYESRDEFDNVAGLDNLKQWLRVRGLAFSDRAAKFGLPAPRGVLLLGVQGCGKSLCAKAVSSLWRLPLLRFDIGRMFGSLVGSSEENVRRAIQTAESIAPAILWVDEIDKALAGSVGSAASDGGTSSRVFGTLLTWLSEKTAPVFVIATANSVSHLPPELLRKGRLDEIFFVDLPIETERRDVFRIHLEKRRRNPCNFDLDRLAELSDGFSGAEIEEAIIAGLFDAFSQGTDLTMPVLELSLSSTVPLSKTMNEELNRLRNWAQGRTRGASSAMPIASGDVRRKIEL